MKFGIIGAIVGGAIGFAIGGPAGAYWGWAVGSTAGSVVDASRIKGPSVGEISQQTSEEGVPIPVVYGISPPITGNVMAAAEPRIEKKKSGEEIYRTYAMSFCDGPVGSFNRTWPSKQESQ